MAFNDLTVPVGGIPISVTRTYDSRDKRTGDFGMGWFLGPRNVRLEKSANLGKFWFQNADFTGFLGSFSMVEGKQVTITFPDGKVFKFQGHMSPMTQSAGPITAGNYKFVPIAPTLGTLTAVGQNSVLVTGIPEEQTPFVASEIHNYNGTIYNPTTFQLTTQEGTIFIINQQQGLLSMTDTIGNTVTINNNGIISSTGKSIAFTRDAQNRITRVEDPSGNAMTYEYDANGDLVKFVDAVTNATQFTYDASHYLKSIIDPRGITPLRNEYDADGRLTKNIDAFGKEIVYTHNIAGRAEMVEVRSYGSLVGGRAA